MKTKRTRGSQSGIALFMVMSSLAVLTLLVAELTYTSQLNARLAFNFVDNLKASYLAKAAFRMSLVRLKAYMNVKNFADDPANKMIKDMLNKAMLDKIWSTPLPWPLPIPKDAMPSESDAIKDFIKESKLSGSFMTNISSESAKLNLNNLFIKKTEAAPAGASGASGSAGTTGPSGASGDPAQQQQDVDFSKVLEPAITSLFEQKKDEDKEFADIYRNVNGKDVVDAIMGYLFPDIPPSNLPGFKPMTPKQAPVYSLTELHFIPGIDDEIYNLLAKILTVYTTPGINVNSMSKQTLLSLVPEMTNDEAVEVIRKRDDPDVGQLWNNEDEFWTSIGATTAGKALQTIKDRFKKANIKVIVDELSFKISIESKVGLSTRRVEAYVTIDPKVGKGKTPDPAQGGQQPGVNMAGQPQNPQQKEASAKKTTGINLVYWRML